MKISQLINLKRENVKREGNNVTGYVYKNDKKIKFKTTNKLYNNAIKAKNDLTKAKNEITKQKNQLIKMNKAMNKILKQNEKITEKLEKTEESYKIFKKDIKKKTIKNHNINNDTIFVSVNCVVRVITAKGHTYTINETKYFSFESDDNLDEQIKERLDQHYPFIDSWCVLHLESYTYTMISKKELQKRYKGDLSKVSMFSSSPISYYFIKNGNIQIKNTNQCVYDAIEERYKISKEEQFKIYSEYHYNSVNAYERFTMDSGVSTQMIKYFCEQKRISMYVLAIDESIIIKYVHENVNCHLPCLVYFMVNSHMYIITDKKEIKKIVRNNDSRTTNYTSSVLDNERENEINDRDMKFIENKIIENVSVDDLTKHKDVNIIYNTNDLKEMLHC